MDAGRWRTKATGRSAFGSILLCALLLCCAPLQAIVPETGLYWSPAYPGRGAYIEVQNGRVVLFLYAFDRETGAARVYSATGPLTSDAQALCPGVEAPFGAEQGYFPLHGMSATLYELKNGHPLGQERFDRPGKGTVAGVVSLRFGSSGFVFVNVYSEPANTQLCHVMSRFNFGAQSFLGGEGLYLVMHDLKGTWVFVDQADTTKTPLRFDFTERTPAELPNVIGADWWSTTHIAHYRDPTRDAELHCGNQLAGDSDDPREPQKGSGCELYVQGQILLSFRQGDVGLDRIQAFRGGMPPRNLAPYRREGTMIGLRVRDVP
jgi:hypothetical protein